MAVYKLELLRKAMIEKEISALVVPSGDPHFGEYIQAHYKCVEWLSGFNGSAGTIAVTLKDAALWTDSRFFVQAEAQLSGSGIELMKMKIPGTEGIDTWIKKRLKRGERVGVVKELLSLSDFSMLQQDLMPLELVEIDDIFQTV